MRGYMKVFVYGTLKYGFHNHHVMLRAKGVFLYSAVVQGAKMFGKDWPFPSVALMGRSLSPSVIGEVYQIPSACIKVLDSLEGYPRFYQRSRIRIAGSPKKEFWIYHRSHLELALSQEEVPDGIWRKEVI